MTLVSCSTRFVYRAEARDPDGRPFLTNYTFRRRKADAEADLKIMIECNKLHRQLLKVERYKAFFLPNGEVAIVGAAVIS